MANLFIRSEVGPDGANLVEDLRTVAALLGGIPKSDGGAGRALKFPLARPGAAAIVWAAVRRFQRAQAGGGRLAVATGTVQPGDATMRLLNVYCPHPVAPCEQ